MRNIVDIRGKTILIAGSASGIGRATACLAAEQGARIVLLDISEEGLGNVYGQLNGEGHIKKTVDLTDSGALEEVIKEIISETGPLDGLVHCAGISSRRPISLINQEAFEKLMDVNFYSFVSLVRMLLKRKTFKEGGSVVVMSSISSIRGFKAKTEYCVSKAAVDAFVRCAALEYADRHIRVNSVMPAAVATPMAERAVGITKAVGGCQFSAPLGITSVEEVAKTIIFLLSDATSTLTGTSLLIDGGACL